MFEGTKFYRCFQNAGVRQAHTARRRSGARRDTKEADTWFYRCPPFFCNGCPLFFIATFRLAFFLAAFAFFLAAFFLAAVAFLFLAALLGLWFVTLLLLIGALG
uniref:hypothetical protein n=1 Tax=Alloprevotella sp. TaxID=1872471 RepID=UPI00402A1E85